MAALSDAVNERYRQAHTTSGNRSPLASTVYARDPREARIKETS